MAKMAFLSVLIVLFMIIPLYALSAILVLGVKAADSLTTIVGENGECSYNGKPVSCEDAVTWKAYLKAYAPAIVATTILLEIV